jgi:hypothetical protein
MDRVCRAVFTYVRTYIRTYVYVCTHIRMCVCMYVCMSVCMDFCAQSGPANVAIENRTISHAYVIPCAHAWLRVVHSAILVQLRGMSLALRILLAPKVCKGHHETEIVHIHTCVRMPLPRLLAPSVCSLVFISGSGFGA